MNLSWELVFGIATAVSSFITSRMAIKAIIKHEMEACDKRMEAFREGLEYHEKDS